MISLVPLSRLRKSTTIHNLSVSAHHGASNRFAAIWPEQDKAAPSFPGFVQSRAMVGHLFVGMRLHAKYQGDLSTPVPGIPRRFKTVTRTQKVVPPGLDYLEAFLTCSNSLQTFGRFGSLFASGFSMFQHFSSASWFLSPGDGAFFIGYISPRRGLVGPVGDGNPLDWGGYDRKKHGGMLWHEYLSRLGTSSKIETTDIEHYEHCKGTHRILSFRTPV